MWAKVALNIYHNVFVLHAGILKSLLKTIRRFVKIGVSRENRRQRNWYMIPK